MCDKETCQKCICPKCFWHKTDECIEGEEYCEEICNGDYSTEGCVSFFDD